MNEDLTVGHDRHPKKVLRKSGRDLAQRSSCIIVWKVIGIIILVAFTLLFLQLELDNRNLRTKISELHTIFQSTTCDCETYCIRFGELAKRIARTEFRLDNLFGSGIIDVEATLQIALKAIELPPGAQPYQLEDVIYIPDANKQNPIFPKGPAWQFTLQVQKGRFIVSVSAVTRNIIFINEIR